MTFHSNSSNTMNSPTDPGQKNQTLSDSTGSPTPPTFFSRQFLWWASALLSLNGIVMFWLWHNHQQNPILNDGLRASWVVVERPWLADASLSNRPAVITPRIDLQAGKTNLTEALAQGQSSLKARGEPVQCQLWGPFLEGEAQRMSDRIKTWTGEINEVTRPVPVGYVLVLPAHRVQQGFDAELLRAHGVREFFFITEPGPLQGAASLGLYRDLDRARLAQRKLLALGVPDVEVRERLGSSRVYFELRGTPVQLEAFAGLHQTLKKGSLQDCPDAQTP